MNGDLLSKQATEVSAVLKQLAHPVRLKILCCLADGDKTVSEIVESCGASQSWVSQILARMRLEKLVDCRKEGTFVRYGIKDRKISKLMKSIHQIYCNTERS